MTYDIEIQALAWNRHKNVTELNQLLEAQLSPLDNWISNGNKLTIKNLHRFTSTHLITH